MMAPLPRVFFVNDAGALCAETPPTSLKSFSPSLFPPCSMIHILAI